MSKPDHDRVSEIFGEACELPAEQRDAYLTRACAGDGDLRAEVESLLNYEDSEDLPTGAALSQAQDVLSPLPESIGPYRVLERLGEGGMGVVYLAEQREPIQRRVAIKLIQPGIESSNVAARFESERQALAKMNHSNVARVYDAGSTDAGRPYFVMELVEGKSITQHCDDEELSLQERLELFAQVCDGVQHAHQKAIIHRDLKPSNVLIANEGGRAVPKIIDFGVAKAIGRPLAKETLFTEVGQLIGTPDYMSPEQAAMSGEEIDTRSDVYSLGVLLYELVTQSRPFDSESMRKLTFDEVLRVVREDTPPLPSRRTLDGVTRRRLSGDLDWVVMRALEKEPERRYGSPAELAADVRRHLAGELVLAGKPSAWYRLRKFTQRNTIGVAFAATVLLLLIGIAVSMTVVASRLADERDRSAVAAAESDEMLRFVMSLFDGANPQEGRGEVTALQLLEEGVERIEEEFADQPLLQARLMRKIADIHDQIGHDGSEMMHRVLAIMRDELGDNDPEYLAYLEVVAVRALGIRESEQAERLFLELYRNYELQFGPDHTSTLRQQSRLAQAYMQQGKFAPAKAIAREGLELGISRWGENSEVSLHLQGTLGTVLLETQELDQARQVFAPLVKSLRDRDASSKLTRSATYNYSLVLAQLGETDEALDLLQEALPGEFMFSRLMLWNEGAFSEAREHPKFIRLVKGDGCWDSEKAWETFEDGHKSLALGHLKVAAELGCLSDPYELESDPSYDPFRGEPEFIEFLKRLREQSKSPKAFE